MYCSMFSIVQSYWRSWQSSTPSIAGVIISSTWLPFLSFEASFTFQLILDRLKKRNIKQYLV